MPVRLVLIEDSHADVDLLQRALDERDEPYELTVLADGEAALRYLDEQARASAPDPCLVILDLYLPRYDGLALLQAIRGRPELAHLRIVVVTTLAAPWQKAELQQLGVPFYHKPAGWAEYGQLSRELFALCHERRQPAANAG